MEMALQAILALLLVTAAGYVQRRIPVFTKGRGKTLMTRAILLLGGIGFGLTSAAYVSGYLPQLLAFLIGFGLVHMPAAVILFIKSKRGEGKS
jgi:hypothetical protein